MPAEQAPQIPQIEVSPITEQELQKPGASKLLYKRTAELEAENLAVKTEAITERIRKDQMTVQFQQADTRKQVLEERLSSLGDRNAICQLIWGAMAITLSFFIEFGRSGNWSGSILSLAALLLLGAAIYLASRVPERERGDVARKGAKGG
ncbi:MAG: hypothetical protein WAO35_05115 [Terriglobia bacterium]